MREGNTISWFLIREIIEVTNSRGAIQSTGYCYVDIIWSPATWSVSESDTKTETQTLGQSSFMGIGGSKFGTQSPDFERDLYDLGQDHYETRWAAELLEYISFWLWIACWYAGNRVVRGWDKEFLVPTNVMMLIGRSPKFCAIIAASGFKRQYPCKIGSMEIRLLSFFMLLCTTIKTVLNSLELL